MLIFSVGWCYNDRAWLKQCLNSIFPSSSIWQFRIKQVFSRKFLGWQLNTNSLKLKVLKFCSLNIAILFFIEKIYWGIIYNVVLLSVVQLNESIIHIYIHIHMYTYIYICIYIFTLFSFFSHPGHYRILNRVLSLLMYY